MLTPDRQSCYWSIGRSQLSRAPLASPLRNVEYSILLVMSELSTVRCDRALRLWIAGTRALSVDGELPWRCCGRWIVRWTAVKGSRDRSLGWATAVASTPGSRAQAATEGGFLGLRHKNQGDGRRLKTPSRGGTGVGLGTDGGDGRRRRLGPRCG